MPANSQETRNVTMTTTMSLPIAGYSHIAIAVTNLDEARAFYLEVLGFEELPRPVPAVPGLWLRVGDLQLHLIVVDDRPEPAKGFPPHFALHIPTDAVPAVVSALRAAGVSFLAEPSSYIISDTPVWAALLADPSG